eukprot:jgi/Chlat1/1177/Chrsp113S01641
MAATAATMAAVSSGAVAYCAQPTDSRLRQKVAPAPAVPLKASSSSSFLSLTASRPKRRALAARASAQDTASESGSAPTGETASAAVAKKQLGKEWVAAADIQDLPKGERLVVSAGGRDILLFWYKQQIYAIENRSPAEGAYSEGFVKGMLTQDGCIVCPTTNSSFYISNGNVKDWYPGNFVLAKLTPESKLLTFPVEIDSQNIYVKVSGGNAVSWAANANAMTSFKASFGGSDTSIDKNNVYAVEPTVYIEGTTPEQGVSEDVDVKATVKPATVITGTVSVAVVALSGTVTCIYYEQYVGLGLFWIGLFAAIAYYVSQSTDLLGDRK